MSWGFEAAAQPGGDKSPRHRVCVWAAWLIGVRGAVGSGGFKALFPGLAGCR